MPEVERALYDGVKNTPRLMAEEACCWIKEGYGSPNGRFFRLIGMLEAAAARGERCVRRGDVYRMAQEQGMSVTLCQEFRFDNNIWSALSRYLLMFRPKLAAVIHPKKASIDTVDLEEVWRDNVSPHTFFYFHTWQEAVAAYAAGDACAA